MGSRAKIFSVTKPMKGVQNIILGTYFQSQTSQPSQGEIKRAA
jgi:hypothetical protein